MADRIVLLYRLRDGIEPAAYEAWARDRDLAHAKEHNTGLTGFSLTRIDGLEGSDARAPYDYLEVIDVADLAGHQRFIATPEVQVLGAEWEAQVEGAIALRGGEIATFTRIPEA